MMESANHGGRVVQVFLGVGSNLGDRMMNLRRAVRLLDGMDRFDVVSSSRVYDTHPIGPPQPRFLNAVIEVSTHCSPREVLAASRSVEDALGRVRGERWGPRVIDIDVLTYGRESVNEPDLKVPHPRMHERAFVLIPLLELIADPPLPGGLRVGSLRLEQLGPGLVRLAAAPLVTERPG